MKKPASLRTQKETYTKQTNESSNHRKRRQEKKRKRSLSVYLHIGLAEPCEAFETLKPSVSHVLCRLIFLYLLVHPALQFCLNPAAGHGQLQRRAAQPTPTLCNTHSSLPPKVYPQSPHTSGLTYTVRSAPLSHACPSGPPAAQPPACNRCMDEVGRPRRKIN